MISGYHLSPQQRRLWTWLNQPQASTFYVQGRVELSDEFNAERLYRSLDQLVAQHPVLRTTYSVREGVRYPLQVIAETGTYTCEISDLTSLNGEEQSQMLEELWALDPWGALDYAELIPLRMRVLRLEDKRQQWFVSLPTIAGDSSSLKEIMDSLVQLYQQKGELGAPAPIQYVQFAEWQNKLLETPNQDADYFWQKCPWGQYRRSTFAFQHSTQPIESYRPQSVEFTWSAETIGQATRLAQELRTELPQVLLAGLGLLVHKHTGLSNVVIGQVNANRKYEQLKKTAGLLAKLLPVAAEVDETRPFADWVKNVQQAATNAQAWAEYFSFDLLGDASTDKAPTVVPVGFEWVDLTAQSSGSSEGGTWKGWKSLTEPFPLKVTCVRAGEHLTVRLDYDPTCYEEAAVRVIEDQYKSLLQHALDNPALEVKQLTAQSAAERERVLWQFNPAPVPGPDAGMVALFEQQVARTPDATALFFGEQTVTYAALNRQANQLAHYLQATHGVKKGDRVALWLERSPRAVVSILAVLKLGAAYVPLDVHYPPQRTRHILEDSQARVLIVDEKERVADGFESVPNILIWQAEHAAIEASPDHAPTEAFSEAFNQVFGEASTPADLAYVMYTSGSTGRPKGVQITVANLTHYVTWANAYYFDNQPGKNFALFTSMAFDLTVTSIFTTLLRGDALVIEPGEDIAEIMRRLFEPSSPVQAVKLTPSHVSLLKLLDLPRTSVAYAILGGEALTAAHTEQLWALNPAMRIFNEYGPTETTVGCTVAELAPTNPQITIGQPIANTQVYLLDEYQRPTAIGEAGEICIGGAGVARGYWQLPTMTAEKFVPHPFMEGKTIYRTGDRGQWLPNGELRYLGRQDRQVKVRGYRIELSEIEQTLLRQPDVREALVLVRGEGEAAYLVAYVLADSPRDPGQLKAQLAGDLPDFMVPAHFISLGQWPLTTHGKIDTDRLPDPLAAGIAGRAAYVAPRNPMEAQLQAIWAEVLGQLLEPTSIGVHDNFFTLGGHSIKALQIISRISKTFGANIKLTDMFVDPTIAGLASLINRAGGVGYVSIEPLPEREWYDVSYAQRRLWILDKLETNKIVYNMPGAYVFAGAFDQEAFVRTIETILDRHESLRTTFINVDNEPRQKINSRTELGFEVGYADLRGIPEPWEEVKKRTEREAATPFDLTTGPLWRVGMLQVEETVFVVTFTLHHIVGDAWSIGVLMNEISTLYNAFSQGQENPLLPLPIQYKDYAVWQNQQIDDSSAHRDYWLEKLTPLPPRTDLPNDFSRPRSKSLVGKQILYRLEPALTQKLMQVAQEQRVSAFTVFLSAFYTLLFRLTKQEDLVIGTSVAGREHLDLEGQIGFFVNLLAIRTGLQGQPSFLDLLSRVNENTLGAFEHQLYPFDRLIEDLGCDRELNRSPLFDMLVVLQNTDIAQKDIQLSQLSVDNLGVNIEKCEFDVIFNLIPSEEGLIISTHYSAELFEEETLLILLEKLRLIAEAVCADPTVPLTELAIELAEERQMNENNADIEFNF